MRKIAFVNEKGGSCKTTFAVNIAAWFAGRGKKVLLVDLDPQGQVGKSLGLPVAEIEPTVFELLTDPKLPATAAIMATQIPNLDAYIRIVKDKTVLRRIIFASQHMMNRALLGEEEPDEILSGAEETLLKLGEARVKSGLLNPDQILQDYEGGINAFLDPSKRIKGISTGFAKFDELTGGLHGGDLCIVAARPSSSNKPSPFFRSKCRANRSSPACSVPPRASIASASAPGISPRKSAASSTTPCMSWWKPRSISTTPPAST